METKEALSKICTGYGIALVYLFGSQADKVYRTLHGEKDSLNDPLADIDIGVVFRKQLPPAAERYRLYSDIANSFTEIFRPFPVDLSFLEENHAVFQVEAIKGFCIFSADQQFKENYEEMILRRAADFRPVLDLFLKEALEGA